MPEIELSVMVHTPQTVDVLRQLLDEFEAQSSVHVNLRLLQWDQAHAELNKIALYHHGSDVSEIGSTWVSDLIAMNALRPFSAGEVSQIGKPEEFLSASWNTGHLADDDTQWAIPWLAETFVIHYRRDLLEKAGLDEATAFSSHAQLAETAARLQERISEVPVELPLNLDSFSMMHVMASWVWTAGGEFCAPDGRQVLFHQPEAASAIRDYFQLVRSLSPENRRKVRERKSGLFERGESAVNFGTLVFYRNHATAPEHVRANWGVSALPGDHFVGGSNLVVWKHTRNERAARDLVRFLSSAQVQPRVTVPLATLPPRLSALEDPRIAQDAHLSVFAQSVRSGRSYNNVPLWGLIEDRLINLLQQMSPVVASDEPLDLDAFVQQNLNALARRLNLTLQK